MGPERIRTGIANPFAAARAAVPVSTLVPAAENADSEGRRRSTFRGIAVSYAAVGITAAADFLRYPPGGFRAIERSIRLGSGPERFRNAAAAVMTWGAHQASGVSVVEIASTDPSSAADAEGSTETVFAADGTPYLTSGMAVTLAIPIGKKTRNITVRVVSIVDELNRIGFAYGTLRSGPIVGEESFVVEHRADSSVWFTVRACTRVTRRTWRFAAPVFRVLQKRYLDRYLRSLAPGAV